MLNSSKTAAGLELPILISTGFRLNISLNGENLRRITGFSIQTNVPMKTVDGSSNPSAVLEEFNTYQEFTPLTIGIAVEQKNRILQEAKANL